MASGLAVAVIPVMLWTVSVWLGGVLGGGAAALLTPPICMVLVWLATRRPQWAAAVASPDRAGASWAMAAVGVALCGALWWAGWGWDRLLLAGVLAPVALWVWMWGALGFGVAKGLGFPAGFLVFTLPWEHFLRGSLDAPLQAWTAAIAHRGLNWAGYDLSLWMSDTRVGYLDTIYSSEYFVIVNETCSGMNMLMTLSMYTLIYGWLVQPRVRNRLVLLALVFPLAMLANGARVATIYLLGHYGGVPAAEGFWHTGSAYVIFLPVFWVIYVVDRWLSRRDRRRASAAPPTSVRPTSSIQ